MPMRVPCRRRSGNPHRGTGCHDKRAATLQDVPSGGMPMTDANFLAVAAAITHTLENQGFTKLVGAEVVSVEKGVVVMALDRRPEVLQQNGLFHGGVLAYLVDNATTAAAGTMIDRAKRSVITAEYKDQPGGALARR